jgi:hypothetical protein
VAAYAAWVAAQDARARMRGAARPERAAPLPETEALGISEAASVPPRTQGETIR